MEMRNGGNELAGGQRSLSAAYLAWKFVFHGWLRWAK
jgi:hypothetical protein